MGNEMSDDPGVEPFTTADLVELGRLVVERWTEGIDRDWRARAGTLEWNCLYTADHLVDAVFSYGFFLASRKTDDYPHYGELHTLAGAGPGDMIEGLRAVTTMLVAVIETAEPGAEAVIMRRPAVRTGTPSEFAARGGLELILHAHDVCSGIGIPLDPPPDLCRRLFAATRGWPGERELDLDPSTDPWGSLLESSGRPRP